jgi:hypothetical protein
MSTRAVGFGLGGFTAIHSQSQNESVNALHFCDRYVARQQQPGDLLIAKREWIIY